MHPPTLLVTVWESQGRQYIIRGGFHIILAFFHHHPIAPTQTIRKGETSKIRSSIFEIFPSLPKWWPIGDTISHEYTEYKAFLEKNWNCTTEYRQSVTVGLRPLQIM